VAARGGLTSVTTAERLPADLVGMADAPPISPALVDLLVHSGRLTGDALAATVVDLAARGWIHLEQIAPGEVLCRFAHQPPTGDVLREHERQALDLLRSRAVDGVVPAGALGQGVADEAGQWWNHFVACVAAEGDRAHLVRRVRTSGPTLLEFAYAGLALVLFAGAILAAGLVDDSGLSGLLVTAAIVIGLAGGLAIDTGVPRTPLTTDGIYLGSRWITERERVLDLIPDDVGPAAVVVRGRTLAYACAVGSAPGVAHGLPRGPDSTRMAWVCRAGMWHQVRLYYPVRLPRGWGRPPLTTILPALGGVVVSGAVLVAAARPGQWHPAPPFSEDAADFLGSLEPLVAGVALVVFLLAVSELARGLWDVCTTPRILEGQVVARWMYEGSRWNPWRDLVPRRWYVVVDDGMSSTLRGLRVSEDAFHKAHRGDLVSARVGRAQGFVHEMEIEHPRRG
jgi:hypothetical protein